MTNITIRNNKTTPNKTLQWNSPDSPSYEVSQSPSLSRVTRHMAGPLEPCLTIFAMLDARPVFEAVAPRQS